MDLKSWSTATPITVFPCSKRINSMTQFIEVELHIQVVLSMNLNLPFDK